MFDAELVKIILCATRHLKFVVKYGENQKFVMEGKIMNSPSPEKFEKWIKLGAPGIVKEDLDNYLHDNPL